MVTTKQCSGETGTVGATVAGSSRDLVPCLEAILLVAPWSFQPEFQSFLDDAYASKPVGLVDVVALCCRALEDIPKNVDQWASFSDLAWDLITAMVQQVVTSLKGHPQKTTLPAGEILGVPAKTSFLVGLLLAKKVEPRKTLARGLTGAVSIDDLSAVVPADLFESGPAEVDRRLQFETLVWRSLFPTLPSFSLGCNKPNCEISTCAHSCGRRTLYVRLGSDARMGRPHFVMINPGSGSAWKDIATKATEIVFVEPDGSATSGLDEDQLAFLISKFLELTSKETA